MSRTKTSGLILIIGLVGGCAPAPKPVRINFAQFSGAVEQQSATIITPQSPNRGDKLSATVEPRPPRLLQENAGATLWAEALQTLRANRERSRERLMRDLERKYRGEERAKVIAAEERSHAEDDQAWQETLAEARRLIDSYAAQKASLSIDLASRVGFPDRGQPVAVPRSEEVYKKWREDKVAGLREQVKAVDEAFEVELSRVLDTYEASAAQRRATVIDLDYAADRTALAKAEAETERAIREVMGQVDAAVPELAKQLQALSKRSVSGKAIQIIQPGFPGQIWTEGLAQADVKKYAKVFLESRGYRLVSDARAPDATEEFRQWLNRNAVTR